MKSLFTALALVSLTGLAAAQATPASGPASGPSAAQTTQRSKMGACNEQAGDKKGDERKAFMKECLAAKKDGRAAQHEKMKTCNADAKTKALKGDERKAFMKECLSKIGRAHV